MMYVGLFLNIPLHHMNDDASSPTQRIRLLPSRTAKFKRLEAPFRPWKREIERQRQTSVYERGLEQRRQRGQAARRGTWWWSWQGQER